MSTPQTIINELTKLVNKANQSTGKTDTTIHDAIESLLNGSGGSSELVGSGEVENNSSDIYFEFELPQEANLVIVLAENPDPTKTYGTISVNIPFLKNIISNSTDYCTTSFRMYGNGQPSAYMPNDYLGIKYNPSTGKYTHASQRANATYNMQRSKYKWYAYNLEKLS